MKLGKTENYKFLLKYLPSFFSVIPDSDIENLCEIRLRADRPATLVYPNRINFLSLSGRQTEFYSEGLFSLSAKEIEELFIKMCDYSVHSLTENIAEGFITLANGCRVGVYGTAVTKDGKISSVRNVDGLNIRLSAEQPGCARSIYNRLFLNNIKNTVICGPPMSGKTTILRDLCRLISNNGMKKIAVIDERCELCGGDLGFNTDILRNYPKAKGIEIAVRTLSPDVIVCDEIGTKDEADKLCSLFNSGIKFIVSMHCSGIIELRNKPQYNVLNDSGAIEACVILSEKNFSVDKIMINRN